MAKPSYTEEDQQRLADAWIASNLPITVWCNGEDDGVKRPNIQTFRKFPAVKEEQEKNGKSRTGRPAGTPARSTAVATSTSNLDPLRQEFEVWLASEKENLFEKWLDDNEEVITQRIIEKAKADVAKAKAAIKAKREAAVAPEGGEGV